MKVMEQFDLRGFHIDMGNSAYRGKHCDPCDDTDLHPGATNQYPEHDDVYLMFCLELLRNRGGIIEM